MKRYVSILAALCLLWGCLAPTVLADTPKDFGARVFLTRCEEPWYAGADGSGEKFETVLVEYQLKGSGIKSYQGIWLAIDTAVLIPVPYEKDGYSLQEKIGDGTLPADYSSCRWNDDRYYRLRETADNGLTVTDQWSFGSFNANLLALSPDKDTLYLCPQPSQAASVTYKEYTTVVAFRFAVAPGASLTEDSLRLVTAEERKLLHQSFIAAMCDGRAGYYYGDASGNDTLAAPSVVIGEGLDFVPEDTAPTVPTPIVPTPIVPTPNVPAHPFTDIPTGAPYADAIDFVYARGLFDGVSKTEFAPDDTMTRAMFVTVLGRLSKVDVTGYTDTHFTDVVGGSWYAPYVAWATEQGIVEGYGNGIFGVEDPVTVEQAVVLMARYGNFVGADGTDASYLSLFADGRTVSSWATEAMEWGVSTGIYRGENGYLTPTAPAKRSLVAQIFFRYVTLVEAVS